ncbi:hypothetical protein AAMO2058_001393700 [Amorphochlora amoebiformis]
MSGGSITPYEELKRRFPQDTCLLPLTLTGMEDTSLLFRKLMRRPGDSGVEGKDIRISLRQRMWRLFWDRLFEKMARDKIAEQFGESNTKDPPTTVTFQNNKKINVIFEKQGGGIGLPRLVQKSDGHDGFKGTRFERHVHNKLLYRALEGTQGYRRELLLEITDKEKRQRNEFLTQLRSMEGMHVQWTGHIEDPIDNRFRPASSKTCVGTFKLTSTPFRVLIEHEDTNEAVELGLKESKMIQKFIEENTSDNHTVGVRSALAGLDGKSFHLKLDKSRVPTIASALEVYQKAEDGSYNVNVNSFYFFPMRCSERSALASPTVGFRGIGIGRNGWKNSFKKDSFRKSVDIRSKALTDLQTLSGDLPRSSKHLQRLSGDFKKDLRGRSDSSMPRPGSQDFTSKMKRNGHRRHFSLFANQPETFMQEEMKVTHGPRHVRGTSRLFNAELFKKENSLVAAVIFENHREAKLPEWTFTFGDGKKKRKKGLFRGVFKSGKKRTETEGNKGRKKSVVSGTKSPPASEACIVSQQIYTDNEFLRTTDRGRGDKNRGKEERAYIESALKEVFEADKEMKKQAKSRMIEAQRQRDRWERKQQSVLSFAFQTG